MEGEEWRWRETDTEAHNIQICKSINIIFFYLKMSRIILKLDSRTSKAFVFFSYLELAFLKCTLNDNIISWVGKCQNENEKYNTCSIWMSLEILRYFFFFCQAMYVMELYLKKRLSNRGTKVIKIFSVLLKNYRGRKNSVLKFF